MDPNQPADSEPTIDPSFALLADFPPEIQHAIITFTFVLQMEEAYSTNDLEEMARRVCNYPLHGWDKVRCWVTALLDLGIRIPDPPCVEYSIFSGTEEPKYKGWTAFQVAAKVADIPLIRRLIRLGYDINALDSIGDTVASTIASHISAGPSPAWKNLFVLRTLCEEGVNVNAGHNGRILEKMLYDPAKSFTDENYNASINGFKLLLKHGVSLNHALHGIADDESNVPEFLDILVDAGADLEELQDNMTPLTAAASKKSLRAVKALIRVGANVNCAGENPLFAAIKPCRDHHVYAPSTAAILTVLCNAGADTTQLNHVNQNILLYALQASGDETRRYNTWDAVPTVVEALCKGGADVNFHYHRDQAPFPRHKNGDTPLHVATHARPGASWRDVPPKVPSECVEILILHGAEVDSQNDAGETPLHLAVLQQDLLCVQTLLRHGSKTDVENVKGRTPLMLAQTRFLEGTGGGTNFSGSS